MSKSKGNVVGADEAVEQFGADTARIFCLFAAPPEKDVDWREAGVDGMYRFLGRVYRFVTRHAGAGSGDSSTPVNDADRAILRKLHQTIQKVTGDFETRWHFNTSLAAIMELTNDLYAREAELSPGLLQDVLPKLVLLLGPFAPYLAEDLWEELGRKGPVLHVRWPEFDPDLAKEDQVQVVVQVNGKLRSRLKVARGTERSEIERLAREDSKIVPYLDGKTIRKVIVVADKLVNFAVG